MDKLATAYEEEMNRTLKMVKSKDDRVVETNHLFNEASKYRKMDRQLMEKLFIQTPAAVTVAPTLQKEATIAPNVTAFFEKKAHLTPAQRLYPELLKATSPK